MRIKYFVQDGENNELLQEHDRNIHVSTMILSAKSLYIDHLLYDVIESVFSFDDDEIQITLIQR